MSDEKREELMSKLEKNLPAVRAEAAVEAAKPKEEREVQEDYDFSRKTYRDLVEKSNKAIEVMLDLALQAEHPRAFEVLSTMLKNTSEIADKLMELQKKKRDVAGPITQPPGPQGGSQTINFIGSTAELQKHLIEQLKQRNAIDTVAVTVSPA